MTERYQNFRELCANETKNDYKIYYRPRKSSVLIMAPHGGNIEQFTSHISEWISGKDFSLYSFEGIKKNNIKDLHITSHHFDEPLALKLAKQAETIVTIHGLREQTPEYIMVGGLDLKLRGKVKNSLIKAGFNIQKCEVKYGGLHPDNICNRGSKGKGIQLEITGALRKKLFEDINYRMRFVKAIRSVLIDSCKLQEQYNLSMTSYGFN